MNLVSYANKWYKLASVWVLAAIGVLEAVSPALSAAGVSESVQGSISVSLVVLGIVARLIKQDSVTNGQ